MAELILRDKVIFLTGGAQGIGRECALAYSREGARVVIADCAMAHAEKTAAELDNGIAVFCDVGDGDSVREALEKTLKQYGRLDGIHNNAGIVGPARPLHETTESEWQELERVNLRSIYHTNRWGIAALKESKGTILNTASMVGIIGQADHAAYVAMKGGMIALTKAMALDYARFHVRVNAICPAGVWTPMLRDWAAAQSDPAAIEQYLNEIHPLGYCPEGDVVAEAAAFLMSQRARFITGCILPVSGGAELGYRRNS